MESNSDSDGLNFMNLQARLIRVINARILNGEFTERGLGRILGVSQPQIHNVLKGARKLSPELADRFLDRFGMSLFDLLETGEMKAVIASRTDCWRSDSGRDHRTAGELGSPRKANLTVLRKEAGKELSRAVKAASKAS